MVMLDSTYGFPGAVWCTTSVFFVLMVWPKLSQAIENLSTVNNVLHVGSSVHYTVVVQRKLVDDISFNLGLCLKPSEVEDRAAGVVSNVNSIIQATKCIAENMILKRDGDKTHPCLIPLVKEKATELSLLSCTLVCMPS